IKRLRSVDTHTHTHTHADTHTQTHTRRHTHTHTRRYTGESILTCLVAPRHPRRPRKAPHSSGLTCTFRKTDATWPTYTLTYTDTHIHAHAHADPQHAL